MEAKLLMGNTQHIPPDAEREENSTECIDNPAPPALHDVIETAAIAGLVYMLDDKPGYKRVRTENGFQYLDGDKNIEEEEELNRIKKLGLPPAWENVWISKLSNGHLQATGYDKLNRKQYRYHAQWVAIRNQTKFYRLKEFCESLPSIRENIRKDLARPGFPQRKVLAAAVSLLEKINVRIGNSAYEKLYGSFGLTTLKNRHVKINGSQLQLSFKGKKGIKHNITLSDRRLARIIKGCRDIPGKELFEYYDEDGNIHSVDSGMVNSYIKSISEGDFTAKDFRTWAGTTHSLRAFKEVGDYKNTTDMNHKVAMVLDSVATKLGNTRNVCKKYYVHPLIIDLYKEKKLEKYTERLSPTDSKSDFEEYQEEEAMLQRILDDAARETQTSLIKDTNP